MTVRRILCETLAELLRAIREHAKLHKGFELADDVTEKHFGFLCTKCEVWWSAPVANRLASNAHVKAHFDSLKSRQNLLLNLKEIASEWRQERSMMSMIMPHVSAIVPEPPKPPETVFEHLMDNEKE